MVFTSLRQAVTPSSSLFAFALAAIILAIALTACTGASGGDDGELAAGEPAAGNPASTIEPAPSPTLTQTAEEPQNAPSPTAEPVDGNDPTPTPESSEPEQEPTATLPPDPEPLDIPSSAFLDGMTHMYQTFNNCSAASVCMLLSHYDVVMDQETLRPVMRPNDGTRHGKNEYMIGFLREQGFEAELLHGGDIETLQAFLAHGIPVIVQQWLEPDPDPIGHYSVVRGYDDDAGVFRLNDSMHGEDFHISYDQFIDKWHAFSYRYIPVYPPEMDETVGRILGDKRDRETNRQHAMSMIESELEERPDDAELWYALGTNLHDLGRYGEAIEAYEHARSIGLPPKMLWYVYWPAEAYNNLGRHQEAVQVAEQQITSAQTFGDMRYQRARAYEEMGETNLAIAEYRQALIDDPRLEKAEDALVRLGAH